VTALALLALATPRLVAELTGLPARVVAHQLEASLTPPPGALDRAIAAGRAAAAWADADKHLIRVALAEQAVATTPGLLPNARRSRLELAEQALRQALAVAPADPVAWTRLAYVTLLRGGNAGVVSGALALSVVTGPNEGGLLAFRSTVAAAAWDRLDQRSRSLFASQFVKTMAFAPQPFVDGVRRTRGVAAVRAQLEDQPRLEREFDRLLLIMGRH
jgi:hypothetical protein